MSSSSLVLAGGDGSEQKEHSQRQRERACSFALSDTN